jgi:hypothetical protein
MSIRFLLLVAMLSISSVPIVFAQPSTPAKPAHDTAAVEKEIRDFYDAYAADLLGAKRESIAARYDERGYYRMGNGSKRFVPMADVKEAYLKRWSPPKTFAWKDLSIEIMSPEAAVVTSLFDWETSTLSYTALLTKRLGKWLIRVEDESMSPTLYAIKDISGSRSVPGPFKYTLTAQPTASISAHRHSVDMKITVKSGQKFILMGDLNATKVQRFDVGSTFTIPAGTWHVEWWETETVEEIEVVSPMKTERASPATPRMP